MSPMAPQPQSEVTTTALTVSAINPPIRVFGSDGRTHLEYDLMLQSMFDAPVTVTSIEVLAPDGASLLKLDGDEVAKSTSPAFTGPPTAVVPPSGTLPADNVPARLNHRIRYRPGTSELAPILGTNDIVGPELDVDPRQPLEVSAPLNGRAWLNANSCCVPEAPHRRGRIAVDGNSIKKFEEFAIDWVQLRDGKLFDGLPEQTPNAPVKGMRGPRDYSGNQSPFRFCRGSGLCTRIFSPAASPSRPAMT